MRRDFYRSNAGLQICTAPEMRLGFYGARPVPQPSSPDQAPVAYAPQRFTGRRARELQALNDGLVAATKLANQLRADLVAIGLVKGD